MNLKKLSLSTYIIISIICIICLSCSSDDAQPSEKIIGEIDFFSEFNNAVDPQPVSIKVYENGESVKDVTTENGSFEINGLSKGIYDLTFGSEGFDEMKIFGLDSRSDLRVRLSQIPSHKAKNLKGRLSNNSLAIDFEVINFQNDLNEVSRRLFALYLSSSSEISKENYDELIQLVITTDDPSVTFDGNNAKVSIDAIRGPLLDSPVGTQIYLQLYPVTENFKKNGFEYESQKTGLDIFTGIGEASNSVMVISE